MPDYLHYSVPFVSESIMSVCPWDFFAGDLYHIKCKQHTEALSTPPGNVRQGPYIKLFWGTDNSQEEQIKTEPSGRNQCETSQTAAAFILAAVYHLSRIN